MISIICILGKNNAIGKANKLIWDLPADLAHFRKITAGHPIIMGRKTFESIGRPLPNRANIIITKRSDFKPAGCITTNSLEAALAEAEAIDQEEVFIIGGGEIFRQAINLTDKLYLTLVDDSPKNADTFFPDYTEFENLLSEESHETDGLKYKFMELIK